MEMFIETNENETSIFEVEGVEIGNNKIPIIAGPCSVESEEQIRSSATLMKALGISTLRAGSYKPRTSPYSFQGLGEKGLQHLKLARLETGLPIVTEVMDTRHIELVSDYAYLLPTTWLLSD